jgi:adenosylcobinamide-phosphate synthase
MPVSKRKRELSSSMMLSKQRLRGRFALEEGAAVLLAFGLDVLGEPPAAWHPVVWFGKLIRRLERAAPQGRLLQLLYGVVMLVLAAPAAFLPAAIVHLLAKRVRAEAIQRGCTYSGLILYALIEGMGLKPFFALRMLADAGRSVRLALEQGDLPAARHALQSLVSRERSELTAELAGAAAIESLAENLSDSIVAPLLYYTLFGLPGAAAYRLFNTFDSMVGYHGQYEYLGKAAARLDDVVNALPARLTALLIIALTPLFGDNRLKAWQVWLRDARRTASPNAGHPMAAAAGALGLQLEKVGHYRLGDNDKAITASSVRQAEQMVWGIGCVAVLLTAVLKMLWSAQHG